MELIKYFRKLTGREKPVPEGMQNIMVAAAHQYFISLPHSYFIAKGPKYIHLRRRTMNERCAAELRKRI